MRIRFLANDTSLLAAALIQAIQKQEDWRTNWRTNWINRERKLKSIFENWKVNCCLDSYFGSVDSKNLKTKISSFSFFFLLFNVHELSVQK